MRTVASSMAAPAAVAPHSSSSTSLVSLNRMQKHRGSALLVAAACLILTLLELPAAVDAQVVFSPPRYRNNVAAVSTATLPPAEFVIPFPMDNRALLEETRRQEWQESTVRVPEDGQPLHSGPYRFAKAVPVLLDVKQRAKWTIRLEDRVRVGRLQLCSPGALSLSLTFRRFRVERGMEVYAVASDGKTAHGPFTRKNVKTHGRFTIAPMAGDCITLEMYAPQEIDWDRVQLELASMAHGFRPIPSMLAADAVMRPRSGPCNINVACDLANDWRDQVRSVGMILTANGQGFCTGAMLNNARQDGRALFLTAYHCVGMATDTEDDMLMFNFEMPTCNGTIPRGGSIPRMTAHGLKKLVQWNRSDFSLLEVEEEIPEWYNVFLAGWSADASRPPVTPVGIHHPSGDTKKISMHLGNCTESCWGWCGKDDPLNHWKISRWHLGTTEPGSSGSPLFDGLTKRVVGQLHGGSASCAMKHGYDMYGKLVYSFDRAPNTNQQLKHVLDPDGTVLTMDGADLNKLRKRGGSGMKSESDMPGLILNVGRPKEN